MIWIGKFLGAICGFMIAGPIGCVFGLMLGHYFDISYKGHGLFVPSPKHTQAQDVFFKATFTIMGCIAKSDGRISENEIRVARHIMRNMMLTNALKEEAIHYFREGKQPNFGLDQILTSLYDTCYQQQNLLHLFVEIQLQAAYADGVLSPSKQKILEHVCYRLGINPESLSAGRPFSQEGPKQQHYRSASSKEDLLQNAYRVLGVSSTTNDADLKKTYRKLMSQNHPDKLVSKGLPEEMIKLATQKTQEIKSAYDRICKARHIL